MKKRDLKQFISFLVIPIFFALVMISLDVSAKTEVPADNSILNAIESEFILEPAIPFNKIDVRVKSGIATLTGDVSTIIAKERAIRIAQTVKGVKSVISRIEVAPSWKQSDRELKKNVITALAVDPATDSYEIDVDVNKNKVRLQGTVDSYQERSLVENVTKTVRGVVDIQNDIRVNFKTKRLDREIKPEIKKAFRWDALIDHAMIDVSVSEGDVKLSGVVGSAVEKEEARLSAWVAGVKSVNVDELNVERWARDEDLRKRKYILPSDEELEKAIENAFLYDPRVLSFNIDTEARAGVVTLKGEVDNLKAKRAAEKDARNTVGVIQVRNHLKVRPEKQFEDSKIEELVQEAFKRDPYVDRFEIKTSVLDGIAHLYGVVDSFFEKSRADDIAARTKGVVRVQNHLTTSEDHDFAFLYDPYANIWHSYTSHHPDQPETPRQTFTMKSDTLIKKDIKDEFFWSPFVDDDDIEVIVRNGVATLKGEVDSWIERNAATENALEGGATWVWNELELDFDS